MSVLAQMTKAPADVLDYDIDFDRWLPVDDRITGIAAAIDNATDGSTLTITASQFADRSVKIWLSGGADGDAADVAVTATTSEGRSKEACFRIRIRECR